MTVMRSEASLEPPACRPQAHVRGIWWRTNGLVVKLANGTAGFAGPVGQFFGGADQVVLDGAGLTNIEAKPAEFSLIRIASTCEEPSLSV